MLSFHVDVAFIIVIVDFCKMETVNFNVPCQLMSLFVTKARKKENSTPCTIIQT
jgi:hypothetical protein